MMADKLLGGLPTEEGIFLWQDAISDGWSGNVAHFTDPADPRRFSVLEQEVNGSLMDAGMLSRPYALATAGWDYAALAGALVDTDARLIAAFDPTKAAAAMDRLRGTGQLDANTQLDFTVSFDG